MQDWKPWWRFSSLPSAGQVRPAAARWSEGSFVNNSRTLLLSDTRQLSVCLESEGMSFIPSCRKIKIWTSFPGSAAVGCETVPLPENTNTSLPVLRLVSIQQNLTGKFQLNWGILSSFEALSFLWFLEIFVVQTWPWLSRSGAPRLHLQLLAAFSHEGNDLVGFFPS